MKFLSSRRYRWSVLISLIVLVPFLSFASRRALESNTNNVDDWLATNFEETKRQAWFVDHFGEEEILMISWPGCSIEDPRLDVLADSLVQPVLEDGKSHPPLFHEVFTAPRVLEALTSPPQRLSRNEALERLEGWLVGKDHRTACAIALVSPAGMSDRKRAVQQIYDHSKTLCDIPPDDLRLGGATVDAVAIDAASEKSLIVLSAISYLVCIFLIWIHLKSVSLTLMVFAMAWLNQRVALALVWLTGSRMDAILLTTPILVYVVSISLAVHLIGYYREGVKTVGVADAPCWAMSHAWMPSTFAAVTTAMGLASLGLSEVVPIFKFAIYTAVAVMCSWALLFLLLPLGLTLWPAHQLSGWFVPNANDEREHLVWRWLTLIVTRHHAWIVTASILLLVIGGWGASMIRTTVNMRNLFSPEARIIQDFDWLQTNIGPLVPVEVVLRFPKSTPDRTLERMELVERISRVIASAEHVGATISAATFGPPIAERRALLQKLGKPLPIAESADLHPFEKYPGFGLQIASDFAFVVQRHVWELVLQGYRPRLLETSYIRESGDQELWRISVRVEAGNRLDYSAFLQQLELQVTPVIRAMSSMLDNAEGTSNVTAEFCGAIPIISRTQNQLLRDLINSFLTGFVAIGLTMTIVLRSVSAGALTMIPNVVPSAIVFGAMGWTGLEVDIGTMMSVTVALGVSVDDEMHYIGWFRRSIAKGCSRTAAILEAYHGCGPAMIQTSLICGVGLLVFALSPFMPTARFAWFMFILILVGLVCDLVLMPAILIGPLGKVFEQKATENHSP